MNCFNHPGVPVSAYCRTCGKALCPACRRDANGSVFCSEHVPEAAFEIPAAPIGATPPSPYIAPSPERPGGEWGAAAAPPPSSSTPPPSASTPPPSASTPPPSASAPPSSATVAPPPPRGAPYVHSTPSTAGTSPTLAFILGFIPGVGAIYNGQYAKGLVHAVVFGLLVTILNSSPMHNLEPLFGILLTIWIFYMAFEAHHTAKRRRSGLPVDEMSSLVNVPGSYPGRQTSAGPLILIGLGILMLLNTLDIISFDRVVRYWPVLLIAGGAYMLYGRMEERDRPGRLEARDERR